MYVNKCVKCGREFETKNPKRVICPDCLYPDKKMMINPTVSPMSSQVEETPQASYSADNSQASFGGADEQPRFYSSYSAGEGRPQPNGSYRRDTNRGGYGQKPQQGGGYRRDNNRGGYGQRPQQGGGYRRDNNRGGFGQRPQQGGFSRGGVGNRRPQQGGFNKGGFGGRKPQRSKAPKQLLVSKEQLDQIELLYKLMLPLPNPDAHEVIGEKIGLEPRKVFFGINLVRQKLMLPKLAFPKRKLAISPDQLFAIKNLYEPLLPLPPIGCHKIIAAQLKMDEWRVHVGIGLIRSQMGLERWNQNREDCPAEFKNQTKDVSVEEVSAPVADAQVEEKPKRGRKKKAEESVE